MHGSPHNGNYGAFYLSDCWFGYGRIDSRLSRWSQARVREIVRSNCPSPLFLMSQNAVHKVIGNAEANCSTKSGGEQLHSH